MSPLCVCARRDSSAKGWQFLTLALETFPPGELENYLEMFLRTVASPADRYIRTLHATVYGGARTVPLSQAEIVKVLAGEVRVRSVQCIELACAVAWSSRACVWSRCREVPCPHTLMVPMVHLVCV